MADTRLIEYGLGAVSKTTCKFSTQLDDNPYLLASFVDAIWDTGCAITQPIQIAVSAHATEKAVSGSMGCLLSGIQTNCDPTGFLERLLLALFSWAM